MMDIYGWNRMVLRLASCAAALLLVVLVADERGLAQGGGTGVDSHPLIPPAPQGLLPPDAPPAKPSDGARDHRLPNDLADDLDAKPGDSNCDGVISFEDVDAFIAALVDEKFWKLFTYQPFCTYLKANDLNGDGLVSFEDVDLFIQKLLDSSS
jgi:hypothetical protein